MKVRPDLTSRKHVYQGKGYWVVKEPLGLNYFRFQVEEYAILQMLDGKTSLEEIKERFEREFAPQKIGFNDLQQFIGSLHRSGLITANADAQGRQLKTRRDDRKLKELKQTFSNILAIRFKGIDPDWLLNRLIPFTGWLFTMPALIFVCTLALSALLLVLVQMDVFRSRLPSFHEFFGPSNWLFLGATLALTKVMHEFGHGLSCKRFKGECHEMGVMFLVLTPCLYCNVSDSWMLPNKWHRAAIGAAGMYVEVFIASIATFIWWFSEPGLLNNLCLQIMFVSSVSTLLFNGNPLLRYDGYYILSDIMEVPNLRQKASSILQRGMAKWCLGIEQQEDPFLPQRNQVAFGLYTIASNIYRWVVMFSILMFLNKVFEPYGLKVIGQMIALMGLYGLIVMPLWKLGKFLHVPGRMAQVKRKNVLITAAAAAAIIGGVLYIPVPQWVKAPVEIRPVNAENVFVVVPGQLEEMMVEPGQMVTAGTTLARVTNIDLMLEVSELESETARLETALQGLNSQRLRDKENNDLEQRYLEIRQQLKSIREQLEKKQEQLVMINVPAPTAGMIYKVPERSTSQSKSQERLPDWAGTVFDSKNVGAYLSSSDVLCQIGDPREMEAILYINQDDVELVVMDQPVEIKLEGFPGELFQGRIHEMGSKQVEFVPPGITNQRGGDLVAITDPESGRMKPQSATFPAQVPLGAEETRLLSGMRGRAKIYVEWQPLGVRIWRYVSRTFHFHL